MATKKSDKKENEPVAIALEMTPESEEATRDLTPVQAHKRVPEAYQFNTEEHGTIVVPVGASILVSQEVAEHLRSYASDKMPKGVRWANKPENLPQGTPTATTTITGQAVSAPVTGTGARVTTEGTSTATP